MKYTIVKNAKTYELPQYTLAIAEKLEDAEEFKNKCKSAGEQFRKMYELCCELLGEDKVEEIMGRLEEADPNMINFTYLDIIKAYNKPLNDYTEKNNKEQMNTASIQQLLKMLEDAGNLGIILEQAKKK